MADTTTQFGCPCCQKLLKMPVQSINGHRFCEGCFKQRNNTARCPLCEKDGISRHNDCFQLGEDKFFGDWAVVYEIHNLRATCKRCGCVDSYFEIKQNHIKRSCKAPCCVIL